MGAVPTKQDQGRTKPNLLIQQGQQKGESPLSAMYKSGGIPKPTKLKYVSASNTKIVSFQRVQDRDRVEPLVFGNFNLKSLIFTILACILCIFTPRFGLAHILKSSFL